MDSGLQRRVAALLQMYREKSQFVDLNIVKVELLYVTGKTKTNCCLRVRIYLSGI